MKTKSHKKKEEKILPKVASCCETEESRPCEPRSDVHKHTVTDGESKNPKNHRRENWDQPDENGPLIVTEKDQEP